MQLINRCHSDDFKFANDFFSACPKRLCDMDSNHAVYFECYPTNTRGITLTTSLTMKNDTCQMESTDMENKESNGKKSKHYDVDIDQLMLAKRFGVKAYVDVF